MREVDVVIVGGGPAGIGAALGAARAGAHVVLVDEHKRPAGQYFKRPHGDDGSGPDAERICALRAELERRHVEVLSDGLAWGIFDRDVMVSRDGVSETVRAGAIVLATGAYDRPLPFPGWTLPGVMSAGAAQTFVKAQRVLPGRRVLLAGAGPFLLPVARELAEAGAEVTVAETTRRRDWAALVPAAVRVPALVREAAGYEWALRAGRVRRLSGHKLLAAVGEEAVTGATICRVDTEWKAVAGTEQTLEVDAVAIGYGFLPSTELPSSCGCDLRWDVDGEAWFVAVDETMETSVPGIFAAGEITGVAGWYVALAEGTIAGAGAALLSGAPKAATVDRLRAAALRRLRARRSFGAALNRVFRPRPGLWEGLTDDVVVCRCEEVRVGEIRERIRNGCTSPKALKDWTRAGMGLCQGRICAAVVSRLIAEETGMPLESIPHPSVRPPVKPLPVEQLLVPESV